MGFGTALQVLVMVDGQYPDDWNTTQPFLFDYNAPQILEAVPVPTSGGTLVLRGTDMGSTAPGAVDLVSVRTWTQEVLTCASPVVTVSSQEVQCQLPSGSGTSLDVQVRHVQGVWGGGGAGAGSSATTDSVGGSLGQQCSLRSRNYAGGKAKE